MKVIKKIKELLEDADKKLNLHQFSEVKQIIDETLILCNDTSYNKGKANALRILGTLYGMQGNNNQAKNILLEAYELIKNEDDDFGNIKVNANLGIIFGNLGLYQESIKHFHEAISFTLKYPDKKYLADQYINIGSVYRKMNNRSLSFFYYKKAIVIRKKLNDIKGLGTIYNNIANLYENTEDNGIALGYFYRALSIWENKSFTRGQAVVLYNIAVICNTLKNHELSLTYFEKALFLAIKLDIINLQALTYCSMANLFIDKKKYEQAKDYLVDAEKVNKQSEDSEAGKIIVKTFIKYYSETNDFKSAFEYQKKLTEINELIRNKDVDQKIASMEYDFNIKQKEKETELYKIKNIELRNAYNEIEKKSNELKEMNETLKQLDSSKDAILSIVSHDLKNLIGSIYSILDLLRFENLPEKAENYINMIDKSTQRALKLVKDILEANAIEMKDFKLNLEPYNVNELLKSYYHTFKINAESKMINLIFELSNNDYNVNIQTDRFWQIIDNLLHNAIKFTKPGGKIMLKTDIIKDNNIKYFIIKIQDNGIGISEENLPIIFNRFTKAKRKGTKGEMTVGLGLSIVKKLVELHNGEIIVTSELNKGTEFIVKLPVININNEKNLYLSENAQSTCYDSP